MVGKRNPSKRPRKIRRRRNGPPVQSTRTTGFGSLMAKGIRTLLSILPGSKLTTGIADFAFKSLGYTDKLDQNEDGSFTVDMAITALTANFHLALKDIMFDSYTHGCKVDAARWTSNYYSGKLISLEIRVVPETPYGERRGVLGAVFIPFRNEADQKWYDSNATGVLFEQLKRIPGAKTGPAGSTILLSFRPSIADGRLFSDLSLTSEVGAVLIAFDQTSRDSYGVFAADQFSCMVNVSGIVKLQRPQEAVSATYYSRTIDDKLRNFAGFVKRPDDPRHFGIRGTLTNNLTSAVLSGEMQGRDLQIYNEVQGEKVADFTII